MSVRKKAGILGCIALAVLVLSVGIGSVSISVQQVVSIMTHHLFGFPKELTVTENISSIVWNMRLPRSILAFLAGAALSASGAVMQSVLKNPLASTYTLGISSGASFAAALVMIGGIAFPLFGMYTLPVAGFVGGLITVLVVLMLASRFHTQMGNQTIILLGMVISLFVNACLTLALAVSREHLEQLIFWQMGGFSGLNWSHVPILGVITLVGLVLFQCFRRELDIMSFGEEQAMSMGVELKRTKWILISISTFLTGTAVALVGVIGFVDLIAPHLARRLFGCTHGWVVPMSALLGGILLSGAELISRSILAPIMLPVGAVTALIGAPFFACIFFGRSHLRGGGDG